MNFVSISLTSCEQSTLFNASPSIGKDCQNFIVTGENLLLIFIDFCNYLFCALYSKVKTHKTRSMTEGIYSQYLLFLHWKTQIFLTSFLCCSFENSRCRFYVSKNRTSFSYNIDTYCTKYVFYKIIIFSTLSYSENRLKKPILRTCFWKIRNSCRKMISVVQFLDVIFSICVHSMHIDNKSESSQIGYEKILFENILKRSDFFGFIGFFDIRILYVRCV